MGATTDVMCWFRASAKRIAQFVHDDTMDIRWKCEMLNYGKWYVLFHWCHGRGVTPLVQDPPWECHLEAVSPLPHHPRWTTKGKQCKERPVPCSVMMLSFCPCSLPSLGEWHYLAAPPGLKEPHPSANISCPNMANTQETWGPLRGEGGRFTPYIMKSHPKARVGCWWENNKYVNRESVWCCPIIGKSKTIVGWINSLDLFPRMRTCLAPYSPGVYKG